MICKKKKNSLRVKSVVKFVAKVVMSFSIENFTLSEFLTLFSLFNRNGL